MSKGPFIYTKVDNLEGKPLVNGGQCAALVQWHTHAGKADTWREGIKVRYNGAQIKKGTAVATFVDGEYPNKSSGNHAALYVSQTIHGIYVMDQWSTKSSISKRLLRFRGKNSDGTYVNPSNNGDALSVIMHD